MRNGPFLLFSVSLLSAWLCFHLWLRGEFRGDDRAAKAQIAALEREGALRRLDAQLARHELADWRQHVATLLPRDVVPSPIDVRPYALRSVASAIAGDVESTLELERASSLMERAKRDFRDKRFEESAHSLRELLSRYPTSRYAVEAHFLLGEALAIAKDYEGSVSAIEALVENYPESDETGFALYRLGQIYEAQNRSDDAAQMYRAILKHYARLDDLSQLARTALKAVER